MVKRIHNLVWVLYTSKEWWSIKVEPDEVDLLNDNVLRGLLVNNLLIAIWIVDS